MSASGIVPRRPLLAIHPPLQPRLELTKQKFWSLYMNDMLLKVYVKFQDLVSREEGQDLVEYALVVALIAFGATAGMGALAGGINKAFTQVSTNLGTAITSILF
jgi:pilus assembly protein Flp/PilA